MSPNVPIMGHMRSEVRIAEFKSKLSRYLRSAQAGNEIIIKDRDTPVARLVPCAAPAPGLEFRPPVGSLKDLDKIPRYRPKKLKLKDLEAVLRADRRDRFGLDSE